IIVTGSVDTNTLGVYTITYSLTDSSGNTALEVTRTVYVENGLSLSDMEIMELKIFPNPTSSIWQIKSSRIIESIALFNLIGKRLMYKETFSDQIQIDATSFPDGIYLILINKNNMVRLIKH
ncbi:MAG: immunoglobulin-like domain-containing protein, partial [Flavobacteriaceae bacterium]